MNGHRAHGFSSALFLDSDEILGELNLKGNEVFMDAGCGDGHNAIKVIEEYLPDGTLLKVNCPADLLDRFREYTYEEP